MRNDLIKLRKQTKVSLRKAAREIDISAAALSKIERGLYTPSFPVADAIADYYKQPVEKLFPVFKRNSPLHDDYTPNTPTRSEKQQTTPTR